MLASWRSGLLAALVAGILVGPLIILFMHWRISERSMCILVCSAALLGLAFAQYRLMTNTSWLPQWAWHIQFELGLSVLWIVYNLGLVISAIICTLLPPPGGGRRRKTELLGFC